MITAGIVGGSGYMGGEALRVLLEHPEVDVSWITSRSDKNITDFHPNFTGCALTFSDLENVGACDVVFLAVPSGHALTLAPRFLKAGAKVIDLGSDFRLKEKAQWERVYKRGHTAWDLMPKAAYGLTELRRSEIREASIIANPGCFSSAAIFALAPLMREDLINSSLITVVGLSGTAGAGAETDRAIHHPEIGNNVVCYNVVDHRHSYEMEQELQALSPTPVTVHFTPAYIPITRGIVTICNAPLQKESSRERLLDLFRDFYAQEPFIKVIDTAKEEGVSWQYRPYPWVSAVAGTNYCHIGVDVDPRRDRVVVFSVLDSIGKGGSHAGVQNMNVLYGFPETLGLARWGLHPY